MNRIEAHVGCNTCDPPTPRSLQMHILIVSEMSVPHATGGGETRYALLARELTRAGHRVTWLSMKQRDAPEHEWIDGVEHVHRGPRIMRPPMRPLGAKLRFMVSVVLHLLRHRYDVVDCQTYAPLPAAWLACRLRRMTLVATIHDTSAPQGPSAGKDQWLSAFDAVLARVAERAVYRLPYAHVLTVGSAVRDDLANRVGIPRARISVVSNAIDLDHIDAVAAHPARGDLVFVGRMVPHKHPEAFLQAAAIVNGRRQAKGRPPLRVRLVGGGPLLQSALALANGLGLSDQLLHTGELAMHDDVIAHVKASSLLVLTSTREGFGLVLAEAMACRTAVLAWALPAVAETLGPALAEALVVPHQVERLADAVERLIDDDELRARHVELGRQRAQEQFEPERFTRGVLDVYLRAIASRGG